MMFIIVIGSTFLCLTTKLTFAIFNGRFYGSFTSGDWIYAVLYFNPATTVYDILDKTVGLSMGSGSSYKGMARILAEISDFDPSNFFIRYWWIVSYILQTAVGVFMLKNASRALYRVNRKKHEKKTDN